VAADPANPNFAFGGVRHVADPSDQFSDATPMSKAVNRWNQRRPAMDSDVQGTSDMLSGVHHKSPLVAGSLPGSGGIESPLELDSQAAIIAHSGVGRRGAPRSWGEDASDADGATQTIGTHADGTAVHHRLEADGSVTSTPIGAYDGPNFFGSML
jgi:hypothetical protein